MLRKHSERNGREVFLVSDEPYRFLAYDGVEVPPVLPLYPYSVVIGSFSKSLSIAGERIGYIAVSPQMPQVQDLVRGMIFTNRTLGYVNAPAIGQRIVEAALGANVDVDIYRQRRDCMANLFGKCGTGIPFASRGPFTSSPRCRATETTSSSVRCSRTNASWPYRVGVLAIRDSSA